jgi:hypothetical protein
MHMMQFAASLGYWSFADAEHLATALLIVVGGGWALYQFVLRRSFESALDIGVETRSTPYEAVHLLSVEVTLENRGHRRLRAPACLTPSQIRDYRESIAFPADLQIKMICAPVRPGFVGWWTPSATTVTGIPEHLSLLREYVREGDAVDFFLEPGERCHLGLTFVVPRGDFLIKVVFVGDRPRGSEYWSRIVCASVPPAGGASTRRPGSEMEEQ